MSNYQIIAAITETLKSQVQAWVNATQNGVSVTTTRPDNPGGNPDPRINIFLYEVTPNAAMRNNDLPMYSGRGDLSARPTVYLDLHYLFTFYGDDTQQLPQLLLGRVVSALHAQPLLDPDVVHEAAAVALAPMLQDAPLKLADEPLKVTPIHFSLEDMSKLWSFLLHSEYHISAAYNVSVAALEAPGKPLTPFPVRRLVLRSLPHTGPHLTGLNPRRAQTGATVTLQGANFVRGRTRVLLGDIDRELQVVDSHTARFSIPPDVPAGLTPLRVLLLDPAGAVVGESEPQSLLLVPRIRASGTITAPAGGSLELELEPPLYPRQRVALILDQQTLDQQPRPTAASSPPSADHPQSRIAFTLPADLAPGRYPVRVRIDGVLSELTWNRQAGFTAPLVHVIGGNHSPTPPTIE